MELLIVPDTDLVADFGESTITEHVRAFDVLHEKSVLEGTQDGAV